MTHPI